MNIGIFGGAFNPVHNGHLYLIKSMLESGIVDRIILIPTANPPHKESTEFADVKHRFNMLTLATEPFKDKLEISDIEFKLMGKSYTYNTLNELKKIYKNDDFYLFMGSDQLLYFEKWYRFEDILSLASIVAMSRDKNDDIVGFLQEKSKVFGTRVKILDLEPIKVSSSQIRQAVRESQDISSLVPPSVAQYIKDNNLYEL